jgi:hypothetical protein
VDATAAEVGDDWVVVGGGSVVVVEADESVTIWIWAGDVTWI